MEKYFAVYLPISIINEGSKSATISSFNFTLKSPTEQIWNLSWYGFAENNVHTDGKWSDVKLATPILVHGNSGSQQYLKFIEFGHTSEGWSNVSLSAGKYTVELEFLDRYKKPVKTTKYSFTIGTEASEALAKQRTDSKDYGTWMFGAEPVVIDA